MSNKRSISRIVTSIVASVVALSALSQVKDSNPRLVIGIVIDQLRSDYIELLKSQLSQGGFNRLMRDGVTLSNVSYNMPDVDDVSGTALLMTGAYPRISGVPSALVYNSEKRIPCQIYSDTRYIGNFTGESLSPMALRSSTLSDEVRLNSNGFGNVYAIAAEPQMALTLGGHVANCALWINDVNGNWSTSTFYKDVPQCVQNRNYTSPLSTRLDTLHWAPLLPLEAYKQLPSSSKFYSFNHTFARSDKDRYRKFKQSAQCNREITDLAIECLNTLNLGKHDDLDMLNVGLSAQPYSNSTLSDGRLELHDTYLRLDRDIERLLTAVDRSVGADNAVIFVTSTGHFGSDKAPDAKFNIPTGEFRVDRATSLLNMYLIAIYGNGSWIDGYYNGSFYLNRDLIKERNIAIEDVRRKASDFLRQMSGVRIAYTLDDIINNPVNDELQALYRATLPELAGDVTVKINPGWNIVETDINGKTTSKYVHTTSVNAPIYIVAPGVTSRRIDTAIDAALLAPTVARLLRIRSPNAAQFSPMPLR